MDDSDRNKYCGFMRGDYKKYLLNPTGRKTPAEDRAPAADLAPPAELVPAVAEATEQV